MGTKQLTRCQYVFRINSLGDVLIRGVLLQVSNVLRVETILKFLLCAWNNSLHDAFTCRELTANCVFWVLLVFKFALGGYFLNGMFTCGWLIIEHILGVRQISCCYLSFMCLELTF